MDFPTLARQCAPAVHITTLAAVVRHESGFDPLVIGVNGKPHRSIRPKSRQEAVDEIRKLMADGKDFDVGYGQINVRNWKWLGVTPETILDPCVNLASAQRVLVGCYQRASKMHGPGQFALYAAFSCYNTGNLTAGFKNGYVVRVAAAGGVQIPALSQAPGAAVGKAGDTATGAEISQFAKDGSYTINSPAGARSPPRPDAFDMPRSDALATDRPDAFTRSDTRTESEPGAQSTSSPFGQRVPLGRSRQ
ncbi:lytic transglycosylase domain-containing protein [Achromobacter sp. 413638]|uniref:lytic transglycosylase domain-containing protein n=1 Tax=Achromobacter sp. 413638 TaxID=3342385 RepID=UPI00370BF58D